MPPKKPTGPTPVVATVHGDKRTNIPTADAHDLTAAVVAASAGPEIAAGSVVDDAQVTTLAAAGAWGFTIGGAIFEGRLPGGPDVAAQVRHVLGVAAG